MISNSTSRIHSIAEKDKRMDSSDTNTNIKVELKFDTVIEVNMTSYLTFKKLISKSTLEKPTKTLLGYSKHKLNIIGQCKLSC